MNVFDFFKKNLFIIIGIFLALNWIALVIDRITHDIVYNLFWISHIALLLAAIGFILRSNLLLSGSFISVFIVHGLWVYNFLVYGITGNFPMDYGTYILDLSLYRMMITMHHFYLIPVLFLALWKQKKISIHGWLIASLVFMIGSFLTFFFVGFNVNCANFVCPVVIQIFPWLEGVAELSGFSYLIAANLIMDLVGFLLPNLFFYWIFRLGFRKRLNV